MRSTNRRQFLQVASAGAAASLAHPATTPPLETRGQRYEAVVPATLDLTDRAALAIDPLLKWANSREVDPRVTTDRNTCGPKYLEALALVRTMTGSTRDLALEKQIMDTYLEEVASDGLFYVPPQGPLKERWGNILGQGRLMLAWMAWHGRDPDDRWLNRLEKLSGRVQRLGIQKNDYVFYPTELIFDARYVFCFRESGWKVREEPKPVYLMRPDQHPDMGDRDGHQVDARMGIHAYVSGTLRPLVRWHRLSGNSSALETARKLTRYLSKPELWVAFGEPREMGGTARAHYSGHIHAHTMTLRGLIEYASFANDEPLKQFCREGYEYTRQFGISRIGYIPEWTNNNLCEGCQIADMTALAIRLSDAGAGDYWDDVDSYVRNHLVEQQHTTPGHKYLGVFCAGTYPSHLRNDDYAGCCTANCSDALYYAWESIVRRRGRVTTVNLLLNRASPWLDVDSYLPYEGKVVLKNKAAATILVRIPGWVDQNGISVRGLKGKIAAAISGRHLVLDSVAPRDEITIEFPVRDVVEHYRIPGGARDKSEVFGLQPVPIEVDQIPVSRMDWNGVWYACRFRGNTMVGIEPEKVPATLAEVKGGVSPLYQREAMTQTKAPLVRKVRFAPEKALDW